MRRPLLPLLVLVACGDPLPGDEPPEEPVRFALPTGQPWLIDGVVGVDHDPEVHEDSTLGGAICSNYAGDGFPACYDEHDGTDFLLEGGFETMDAGSADVLAAADGTVLEIREDQYDRCRLENGAVTCDGHPILANFVTLDHGQGIITRYLHLMTDSVVVEPGDEVACGDLLGLMGSSGNSSMPHLHFEVNTDGGDVIDPYAGPLSTTKSWWVEQVDAFDLPATTCATAEP
ncbi:MAG: M23 family metallopeptidase [Proteobacteria bacterium]|nr:M23 family metallopeptidase [Pseudomonadota bacterium]